MNMYVKLLFLFSLMALSILQYFPTPGRAENEAKSESFVIEVERTLELNQHKGLLEQKQNPGVSLAEFSTDGCSGGLSVGWQYLSGKIEQIKNNHGDHPPWESCCITHDRAYHAAGGLQITAEMSFNARRHADEDLRSCVLDTGISRAPELSEQYDLSAEEVERIYRIIGDLMYRAVRLGGVPCSGLPWRWGYGWPKCD